MADVPVCARTRAFASRSLSLGVLCPSCNRFGDEGVARQARQADDCVRGNAIVRRPAGGTLLRRQCDRAMRIAEKVETIFWRGRTKPATEPPRGRSLVGALIGERGETSPTGRSCAGFGRPVIVSRTVMIVDIFGSLHAPRGQGGHLINVARAERRRRLSRSGQPPLRGPLPQRRLLSREARS
jgi:hypothetical protein